MASEEFITHMNKPDLLTRIRQDRANFSALWTELSLEQMTTRPGPQSDWSVKDLIGHILFWEDLMIGNINKLLTGEIPRPVDDFDAINMQVFEDNKDRLLDDLLAAWEVNLPKVLASIEPLTHEQINEAGYYPHRNGSPLLYHIIGNTFGHYDEHRSDLAGYVQRVKA